MTAKRILMGCYQYWTSPFRVGSHHLATGLASRGWDVAYLSEPISPLHVLKGMNAELRERFAIYRAGGIRDLNNRVWGYVPGALLVPTNKPLVRSEWLQRTWASLAWPSIVQKLKQNGFGQVDVLYIDNVSQAYLLKEIGHHTSVLRVADYNPGFRKYTPAAQALEEEVARTVDLVIYSAASLKAHVERMRPRQALYVPNGVWADHFAGSPDPRPTHYEGVSRPIAVYAGAMDVWFDFAVVNRLVEALPLVSFVLIGPRQFARRRLTPRPNLHLVGRVAYSALPAYLQHADVALIPFDTTDHGDLIRHVHPLKLYEYLASGLPVVSSDWEEMRNIKSPAVLCSTPDEFVEGVRAAVADRGDRRRLVAFAQGNDWESRLDSFLVGLNRR